jgi:pimeloyl-ACP methyl ester carboxylesterase
MHLEVSGQRDERTLLLLHGGGVGGWMWNPLRAHLAPRLRLLVPDLPGHDRSAAQPWSSHEQTCTALEALVEREASAPVTVVGFSLGAQLAVLLAARRPDLVERAVIISAQAKAMPGTKLTLALLSASAPLARQRWFAKLQARELFIPPQLMDDYLRTSAQITRETLVAAVGDNLRFKVPERWATFPGPSLVLAGKQERTLMLDSARLLAAQGVAGNLELVEGCGHGIPLQRPEWLAHRLESWRGTG